VKSDKLEKLQFDGEDYILYAPDSLNHIAKEMIVAANKKRKEILDFFQIEEFRKIQINLFDDKDKFRNFILSLREDKERLPAYAVGTYDRGMINAYVDANIEKGTFLYNQKTKTISHEMFHIIYMEQVLENDLSNRVIWLDEGLAQYFSGQKDKIKFDDYFFKVLNETKEIPNMNSLRHGTSFYNESYNGYDLSYLCACYLFEVYDSRKVYEILSNYDLSIEIGSDVLDKMIIYYKNKYEER